MSTNTITDTVREKYAGVAASTLTNDNEGVRAVAQAFGYSADELASIPAEANMGLSCGNPIAMASLRPGEVVVDLGCGGGLDVFLAAQKVGLAGRAIGIDMTPEMIDRARRNAQGMENVEFHLATIDNLPLPDASADVVISNCVINLAPDKSAVLREVHRVLKPGGRVAVSDIALKRELPPELAGSVAAYVGCVAGAITIEEYQRLLGETGFGGVQVIDSGADLNAYAKVENQSGCCSPAMERQTASDAQPERQKASSACCSPAKGGTAEAKTQRSSTRCCTPSTQASADGCCAPEKAGGVHEDLADLLRRYDVNDYAASVKVLGVKL